MHGLIKKTFIAIKGGPGGAGFWVQKKTGVDVDRIYIDRQGSGESTKETVRTAKILRTGAANLTLTPEDDGATVYFDNATSRIVTLPPTSKNLTFRFIIETVTAGAGHKIDPNAADKITGNGLALADGVAIECDGATDRAGDILELEGDGVNGWYITNLIGTWSTE